MSKLETIHAPLMVPHVISMSVVVYTNGSLPMANIGEICREALSEKLPAGTGVSTVSVVMHGVYEGAQGASRK